MKIVWILLVFVTNDGQWREWRSFDREEECIEVAKVITRHREDIAARCIVRASW